mmetsp:Transcript_31427/g.90145  ORF Transcript_31427/g.90145 Transcript_31427/m.90145 type:complete len:206 (+) Transcript_31427:65-682(+)
MYEFGGWRNHSAASLHSAESLSSTGCHLLLGRCRLRGHRGMWPHLQAAKQLMEGWVGPRAPPLAGNELQGLLTTKAKPVHEVGGDDRGAAADAHDAVHQDGGARCQRRLNLGVRLRERCLQRISPLWPIQHWPAPPVAHAWGTGLHVARGGMQDADHSLHVPHLESFLHRRAVNTPKVQRVAEAQLRIALRRPDQVHRLLHRLVV